MNMLIKRFPFIREAGNEVVIGKYENRPAGTNI